MWRRIYVPEQKWKLPEYTWDKDRELCKRCAHLRERSVNAYGSGVVTAMSCAVVANTWQKSDMSCIGARTEGACGPEGKLFEERT